MRNLFYRLFCSIISCNSVKMKCVSVTQNTMLTNQNNSSTEKLCREKPHHFDKSPN